MEPARNYSSLYEKQVVQVEKKENNIVETIQIDHSSRKLMVRIQISDGCYRSFHIDCFQPFDKNARTVKFKTNKYPIRNSHLNFDYTRTYQVTRIYDSNVKQIVLTVQSVNTGIYSEMNLDSFQINLTPKVGDIVKLQSKDLYYKVIDILYV